MTRISIAALALAVAASSLLAQTQEDQANWLEALEKRFPPMSKNAAAEELERLAIALGIRAATQEPEANSRDKSDRDAYQQAGFGSWMDAQIKTGDDSTAAPTAKLDGFLQQRRPIVSSVVALLEREVPDWGFNARQRPGESGSLPDFLMIVAMNRLLLSAALVEERAGRHAEAGEYLEASWSLSQSLTDRPELVSLIIAVALWKQQAGAIRKMSEVLCNGSKGSRRTDLVGSWLFRSRMIC